MKRTLLSLLILAAALAPFQALSAENSPRQESATTSGCKDLSFDSLALPEDGGSTEPGDQDGFKLDYNDGILTVTMYNAYGDCGATFNQSLEIVGDTIVYSVEYIDGMADCMCFFDISSTYSGIEPGRYIFLGYEIFLEEGYSEIFKEGRPSSVTTTKVSKNSITVADTTVTANGNGPVTLCIFDSEGRLISSFKGKETVRADISSLPAGWYVAKASSDSGNLNESRLLMRK